VLEHIENPWQYIRDLRDMTRPGGYLLLSTPNVTSWYSRAKFFLTGRFHQFEDGDRHYGHINPIAADELRYICDNSGLLVKQLTTGGWLPRLWLIGPLKTLLISLFGFLGSFLMQGLWRGWCIIVLAQRSADLPAESMHAAASTSTD